MGPKTQGECVGCRATVFKNRKGARQRCGLAGEKPVEGARRTGSAGAVVGGHQSSIRQLSMLRPSDDHQWVPETEFVAQCRHDLAVGHADLGGLDDLVEDVGALVVRGGA